jgi:hypothetical protein
MMPMRKRGVVAERLRRKILAGLGRTYAGFGVRPKRFLASLQRVHAVPIRSFDDMFRLRLDIVDSLADQTISASKKLAVIEGAGIGLGGFVTLVPDMSFLAVIAMRMLQKLSLIYGFEYANEEDTAELWLAAASAAGLDLGRDFVQKELVERFVPRVMERIAARMSVEVAEKWSARAIPLVSGALGAALNYYFIREWGRRAKRHFRERHLERRQLRFSAPPNILLFPGSTPSLPSPN